MNVLPSNGVDIWVTYVWDRADTLVLQGQLQYETQLDNTYLVMCT
jgi:hypothetical protein